MLKTPERSKEIADKERKKEWWWRWGKERKRIYREINIRIKVSSQFRYVLNFLYVEEYNCQVDTRVTRIFH